MAGKDNLIPIKKGEISTEEAKKRGSKGGKASGIARREKKLLSEIYAEYLAEQNNLPKGQRATEAIKAVISKGGAPAVSMMKEIREATEGNKLTVDATVTIDVDETRKKLSDRLNRIALDRSNKPTS